MTVASASLNNPPRRLRSLDAFRGFTIAAMLLVNNPGNWSQLYPPLAHAKWHGWTFTDCIFPFFLFIGGVAMALSLGRLADAGANKRTLLIKLSKRAAIIFLIGLFLNLIPQFDLTQVRIMGVLQRIALCTVLAAPIVLYCNWRQQCVWIVGLLSFYTLVMLYLPVTDMHGVLVTGALAPGRDAGAYFDRLFLSGHMWSSSKVWDPEGLFTTIPALCSQLLGVLAGRYLLSDVKRWDKTKAMLVAGALCCLLASGIDASFMPINKSLWTTSYCLMMNGIALISFAGFYALLDIDSLPRLNRFANLLSAPLLIFGMNALFIFALSGFIAKMLTLIKIPDAQANMVSLKAYIYAPIKVATILEVNASLLFAIGFVLVMFSIAWGMWKQHWFIKV